MLGPVGGAQRIFARRISIATCIANFVAIQVASTARAQNISTVPTSTIVVTATQDRPDLDPSASASTFDRHTIDRALQRGDGLSELVERAAGAQVLDLGGPIHPKRLRLRGGSAAQNRLVLDGVPLFTPFSSGVDLALIDLDTLGSIQVLRGGAGAAVGDGALTGAVILESRPMSDRAMAALRYGSLQTVGIRGSVSRGPLAISGGFSRSDGAFDFISQPQGLPAILGRRLNNDAQVGNLGLALGVPLGDGDLDLFLQGGLREAGVPGFSSQADIDARETRGHAQARVAWQKPVSSQSTGVLIGAHAGLLTIDYDDPDPFAPVVTDTRFVSSGADAAVQRFFGRHLLSLRVDFSIDRSDSTEHEDTTRPRASMVISDDIDLESWVAHVALRAVYVRGTAFQLLPRAGVRWSIDDVWTTRASAGRSIRTPTIDELFHPSQRGLTGNPDLVPETGWEAEVAVEWAMDDVTAELVGFARRVDDTILYVNRNAFFVRPENLGTSQAVGLELELHSEARIGAHALHGDLVGSVIAARLDVTDTRPPTQPWGSVDAELGFEPQLGEMGYPLEVFTRARLTSGTHANLQNTIEVDPYVRWDGGFTVHALDNVAASLVVTNILDRQSLSTVNKIPLPGRMVLASVRVTEGP